ncbi:hypothetical protein ACOSQ4_015631 [Xanthoceras sorbifolium]
MSAIDKQDGNICLADSATTHTTLQNQKYFQSVTLLKTRDTISGPADLIEGSRRATIFLPNGTKLYINDILYSSRSKRNLVLRSKNIYALA